MTNLITKVGIVTTVADAAEHIDFFIRYHNHIGIFHIFVFIDDCCEETFAVCNHYNNVTAVYSNNAHQENWRILPTYRNLEKRTLKDKEVMVRQEYNAYIGFALAKEIGIDWLIHIDIDELFYPNDICLDKHFSALKRDGISGCIYQNYEAIPTRIDGGCIYTATSFFKKNFFKKGIWSFNEKQKFFIEKNQWLSTLFFNYYQNGKSSADIHYDLIIEDVHSMWGNGRKLEFMGAEDPLILHFPSITFTEFFKKYKRLGNFDDLWKGFPRAGKFIDTLHLDARNAFISGNEDLFKKIFLSRIMLEPSKIESLIRQNLAVKIDIPLVPDTGERLSLLEKINPKQELRASNKPNKVIIRHKNLNNLLPRETISNACLSFGVMSEARVWLRRHPVLCRNADCFISEVSPHNIFLNCQPLCDMEKLSESFINEALFISYDLGDGVVVPVDEYFCLKAYSGLSELDLYTYRIGFIKNLINAFPAENNLFFNIPEDREVHVISCSSFNFYENKIADTIFNSVKAGTVSPIQSYLISRYPRVGKFNWGIDISIFDAFTHRIKDCIYSILYALGGSVLDETRGRGEDKKFLLAREAYPFIVERYAKPLTTNNKDLIVLEKEYENFRFIAISNLTDRATSIDFSQIIKKSTELWLDMMTKGPICASAEQINIPGYGYFWLMADG